MLFALHGHASRLHRRFPMVERDDILQEMYVWWCQHPRKAARYLDDTEYGEKKLSRALRNAGLAYCHKEKARRVGYEVDDLFFYSLGLLRELLPAVYDEDAWSRMGRTTLDGLPRGKSDPAEGNNALAALCDVSQALNRLAAEPRRLIELTFRDEVDAEHLAGQLDTTPDGARMRVQRALRRLQEELGGERPDWRAVSQLDTDEQHDD